MPKSWHRAKKFITHKVLHTDDNPHAIALGAAIGMFVAWFTLIGIQTLSAIAVAALFRANKAICIPMVWISNPFTVGPFYYACYIVGKWIMPGTSVAGDKKVSRLIELATSGSPIDREVWSEMATIFREIGTEMAVGLVVLASILAVVTYFIAYRSVINYRERRRLRLLRRSLFRVSRPAAAVAVD